jgi:acyl-coenzyme A synthetase/AMP-(fatty) acid ligase
MSPNHHQPFDWHTPEYFNFGHIIDAQANADPSRVALLHEDSVGNVARLTFADIRRESNQIANLLNGLGIQNGERVLLMLPRTTLWHAAFVAILKLGAIAVPSSPSLRDSEIVARANRAEAVAIIAASPSAEIVADLRRDCPALRTFLLAGSERSGWTSLNLAMRAASDSFTPVRMRSGKPALCFFSSGATGESKAVLHNAAFAHASRFIGSDFLGAKEGAVHWTTAEPGTSKAAWSALFAPWANAATVFLFNGRFDPKRALRLIAKYRIATLCMSPAEYHAMLSTRDKAAHCSDLDSLHRCTSTGEQLQAELVASWRVATGLTIHAGYAQAETGLLMANRSEDDTKHGSIGTPFAASDLKIVDPDLNEIASGEIGEIALRCKPHRPPLLFAEYLKDPVRTAAALRGEYYLSGDHGYHDQNGYFWFVGREEEMLAAGSHRFAASEVEHALEQHPAVIESAVIAAHHPDHGPMLKAYVRLNPGALNPLNTDQSEYDRHAARDRLERELKEHLLRFTDHYKVPHQIEFLDQLPRTPAGRIHRAELHRRSKP